MTVLSRKVDYALLILSFLNQRTVGASAREIAEKFDLSKPFVANILKELCNKGYVASHRGVKGGYVMARSPEEVTLGGLLESLEESFRLAECIQGFSHTGNCQIAHMCPVKGPIAEVHNRILQVLKTVTLAQIFRPPLPPAVEQFGIQLNLHPIPVVTTN